MVAVKAPRVRPCLAAPTVVPDADAFRVWPAHVGIVTRPSVTKIEGISAGTPNRVRRNRSPRAKRDLTGNPPRAESRGQGRAGWRSHDLAIRSSESVGFLARGPIRDLDNVVGRRRRKSRIPGLDPLGACCLCSLRNRQLAKHDCGPPSRPETSSPSPAASGRATGCSPKQVTFANRLLIRRCG